MRLGYLQGMGINIIYLEDKMRLGKWDKLAIGILSTIAIVGINGCDDPISSANKTIDCAKNADYCVDQMDFTGNYLPISSNPNLSLNQPIIMTDAVTIRDSNSQDICKREPDGKWSTLNGHSDKECQETLFQGILSLYKFGTK